MCVHNLSTFQHLCSFRYLLPSPFLGPSITLWLHSISQPKAWIRGGGTGWAGLPAVRHTGGCGLWASKYTRQHAKVPKESGHGGRLGHCDGQFSVSKAAARTWSRTCAHCRACHRLSWNFCPRAVGLCISRPQRLTPALLWDLGY